MSKISKSQSKYEILRMKSEDIKSGRMSREELIEIFLTSPLSLRYNALVELSRRFLDREDVAKILAEAARLPENQKTAMGTTRFSYIIIRCLLSSSNLTAVSLGKRLVSSWSSKDKPDLIWYLRESKVGEFLPAETRK